MVIISTNVINDLIHVSSLISPCALHFYRLHSERMGKAMFLPVSVCLSTPGEWGDGGIPIRSTVGYPILPDGGITPSFPMKGHLIWLTGGYPHLADGGGTPGYSPSGLDGVPLPHWDWMGYPPPFIETEQHSEHLLCGGHYASCVHAEGLSCYLIILWF